MKPTRVRKDSQNTPPSFPAQARSTLLAACLSPCANPSASTLEWVVAFSFSFLPQISQESSRGTAINPQRKPPAPPPKKGDPMDDKFSVKDITDVTRLAGVNLKVLFTFVVPSTRENVLFYQTRSSNATLFRSFRKRSPLLCPPLEPTRREPRCLMTSKPHSSIGLLSKTGLARLVPFHALSLAHTCFCAGTCSVLHCLTDGGWKCSFQIWSEEGAR